MKAGCSILLVDHSRVSLMFQETVLRRKESRVLSAMSGSEAWDAIQIEHPDLVIFGYDLQDMTGPELCRQVRLTPDTKKTSLLFVTDRKGEHHADLCLSAGCNDILYRPFHWRELDSKVEKLTSIPVRRDLRTLTKLEVSLHEQGLFVLGHSVNVSSSGMLVQVEHMLPPEASVKVNFYLPGDLIPVTLAATVVRAEFNGGSPRYGLQFADINGSIRERIERYVQKVRARDLQ